VLVSPAPGQPGKCPSGMETRRPSAETGQMIGVHPRASCAPPAVAHARLSVSTARSTAAENLLRYLTTRRRLPRGGRRLEPAVERTRDELGDWWVSPLPLGGRVHGGAMALTGRARRARPGRGDDGDQHGIVVRFPDMETPRRQLLLPGGRGGDPGAAAVGGTALFKFRETPPGRCSSSPSAGVRTRSAAAKARGGPPGGRRTPRTFRHSSRPTGRVRTCSTRRRW
jgi:hypothetical protein